MTAIARQLAWQARGSGRSAGFLLKAGPLSALLLLGAIGATLLAFYPLHFTDWPQGLGLQTGAPPAAVKLPAADPPTRPHRGSAASSAVHAPRTAVGRTATGASPA